ncbi:MAG: molecular chaperone HtpG [Bacteroidia bacterium]|nr:molecular chaperone HtpG [Bacteroidia bacterium]MDW8135040.1 molecular chaperone HtpG [Bacteroidia bacterium]
MRTGTLGVNLSGLLPIIRKNLYTHSDVFLRELIANGVDACQKLLRVSQQDNLQVPPDSLKVEIIAYPARRQIVIRDNGVGMTEEEIENFLTVIAASSAREFTEKYKETDIIGFFGMGFYSAFMVADKVEVLTQSYKAGSPGLLWVSEGSENYTLQEAERPEGRGTTVTLYLNKEYEEYAQIWKVRQIAEKYARFLPIPILVEGSSINQKPLWREHPSTLQEADYQKFYRLLYPGEEEPAFSIHLNMDYPISLQGILYFPHLRPEAVLSPNALSLYVKGMFITDQLGEILPEYLRLLYGVIESADVPLNVSRSQLQVDPTVRKIGQYISRKVVEKLKEVLDKDRARYERLWEHVGPFVKYGIVRDEDFAKRAKEICLVETIDHKFLTLSEYEANLSVSKSPKGYLVGFYVNDLQKQGALAALFQAKNYTVIKADTVIDPYWLSYLEKEGKIRFVRVDSEEASSWLGETSSKGGLTLEEEKQIKEALERLTQLKVERCELSARGPAALIVRDEVGRRYQEILMKGEKVPPSRLLFNSQHPLYKRYLLTQDKRWLEHAWDWARLLSGELQEGDLRKFLERDWELLSGA